MVGNFAWMYSKCFVLSSVSPWVFMIRKMEFIFSNPHSKKKYDFQLIRRFSKKFSKSWKFARYWSLYKEASKHLIVFNWKCPVPSISDLRTVGKIYTPIFSFFQKRVVNIMISDLRPVSNESPGILHSIGVFTNF